MIKKFNDEYLDGIDQEYLREAVTWARSFDWKKNIDILIDDHIHCVICFRPIKQDSQLSIYTSLHNEICQICYELFIEENKK